MLRTVQFLFSILFPLLLFNNQGVSQVNGAPNLSGEGFSFIIKTNSSKALLKELHDPGLRLKHLYGDYFELLDSSEEVISFLLRSPFVSYIGIEANKAKAEARVLDLNLVANHINIAKYKHPTINGERTSIHVKEPPINGVDIDLLGRVDTENNNTNFNNHATAMATIIGGSGFSSIRGLGVLPNVNFLNSDLSTFFPNDQVFYDQNDIAVENHSYGTNIENFYGARAAAFDEHLARNFELVTVFSAGNQGRSTPEDGVYEGIKGVANLTGNFKMSKNAIVVGAVDTLGRVIEINSSGPAYDGRIKPDLVAYSMEGTSNAAALVSGSAGFLQELYQEEYDHKASSALIKAFLINGADDVHLEGPDFKTGFGNLNLAQSLRQIEGKTFFEGTLNSSTSISHDLFIEDGQEDLKVTLVWNDLAAAPGAAAALINDLDLFLISPEGTKILPIVPDANPNGLFNPARKQEDHLNNVEQVSIKTPSPGTYQIVISAGNLESAEQEFALVYSVQKKEEFEWMYPFSGANMPFNGETTGYIRWRSTMSDQLASLYFQTKDQDEWVKIGETNLSAGRLRWNPPEVFAEATIKIETSEHVFYSDEFIISRPIRFNPSADCGDSLRFELPDHAGIGSYTLIGYDQKGVELDRRFENSQFTLYPDDQVSFLAIQPTDGNGSNYLRSELLELDERVSSCYLNSFYTEVNLDSGIIVTAELGSLHELESLELLRGEEVIAEVLSADISSINRLIDSEPLIGRNGHRFRLKFSNGQSILSDELVSYFLPASEYLVFPNPVRRGESMIFYQTSVITKEATFYLHDKSGKLVYGSEFNQEQLVLKTDKLQPGIYIYQIISTQQKVGGKIIIE